MYKKKCFSGNGNPCAVKTYPFCYWLPKNKVEEALRECHEARVGGHFGICKTLAKVRQRFFWFDHRVDAEEWCCRCYACEKVWKKRGEDPLRFIVLGHLLRR